MKKLRMFPIMLLALATMICFAGCTDNSSAKPNQTESPASTTEAPANTSEPTEEVSKPTESPSEPAMPENPSSGPMEVGVYPFTGERLTEDEFNAALAAANSLWSPNQPGNWDDFTWSNGALTVKLYSTGNANADDEDQYGIHVFPDGNPNGESQKRSRGNCNIDYDGNMNASMAEQAWDFMAAFGQATTMQEIFDNKDYSGNFFYEDGYSK